MLDYYALLQGFCLQTTSSFDGSKLHFAAQHLINRTVNYLTVLDSLPVIHYCVL